MKKEVTNISNSTKSILRALGAVAGIGAMIAPWVAIPIIAKSNGENPFSRNDRRFKKTITEFDSKGNSKITEQYMKSSRSDIVTIQYYSKWEKGPSNEYSRTIKTYNVYRNRKIDFKELIKDENLDIDKVFGSPKSVIKELKDDLSEDELNAKAYIQGMYYDVDKIDYIMYRQSINENINDIGSYIYKGVLINCLEAPVLMLIDNGLDDLKKFISKPKVKGKKRDE